MKKIVVIGVLVVAVCLAVLAFVFENKMGEEE